MESSSQTTHTNPVIDDETRNRALSLLSIASGKSHSPKDDETPAPVTQSLISANHPTERTTVVSPAPSPALIVPDHNEYEHNAAPSRNNGGKENCAEQSHPILTTQSCSRPQNEENKNELVQHPSFQKKQTTMMTPGYNDYSQMSVQDLRDPSAFIYAAASAKDPPFPVKLHRILCNPEFKDIVDWLPHGRSWRVMKPKEFEEKVIPLHFRHCRYSSFMRQVNGWGFKRVFSGPDLNSYYHELFLRGMPHLCLRMRRPSGKDVRRVATEAVRKPAPDFYALSERHPLPDYSPSSTVKKDSPKPATSSRRGCRRGLSSKSNPDPAVPPSPSPSSTVRNSTPSTTPVTKPLSLPLLEKLKVPVAPTKREGKESVPTLPPCFSPQFQEVSRTDQNLSSSSTGFGDSKSTVEELRNRIIRERQQLVKKLSTNATLTQQANPIALSLGSGGLRPVIQKNIAPHHLAALSGGRDLLSTAALSAATSGVSAYQDTGILRQRLLATNGLLGQSTHIPTTMAQQPKLQNFTPYIPNILSSVPGLEIGNGLIAGMGTGENPISLEHHMRQALVSTQVQNQILALRLANSLGGQHQQQHQF